MKKTTTSKKIDPSSSIDFFEKAEEFLFIARISLSKNKYNSVGLNAVHATISACDALLAKKGGIRSTSKDHSHSVDLLKTVITCKTLKAQINRYKKILKTKNIIAYERRCFSEKEAKEILVLSERFFEWVRENNET